MAYPSSALYPSNTLYPGADNLSHSNNIVNYKTESFTVSKGIEDALWVLSAKIDKHVVPAFFETIQATTTDHHDNPHTPFVGIIPSTDYMLAAAADKATLTGYDYAWYLTVQYVPADDRATLEDVNPSETITTLLGGTAWATVTGIEPHRINNVADWTNIKKAFEFGEKCTRWKAIQEICDYCNFVFVVKWRDVAGTWRPCAYFVHEDDIDMAGTGLNIPAAVTITEPDAYMMDGISVKDSPEHQYNRVLVTGYDVATGTYYYVEAKKLGTEIPIEYIHADASLNTQAKANAKAQELLDFFQASAKVYVVRFKRRMDLELYQKITFSGYDKIDTDEMRITQISYSRAAAHDTVEIEFMKDQAIQQLKRLARAVNPDYVAGTQDMLHTDLSDIGLIDVFDDPVAGGTAASDLWEISGAILQPTDAVMDDISSAGGCDIRGLSLDNVSGIRGRAGAEFAMWGGAGSDPEEGLSEFLRWHNYESGLPDNLDSLLPITSYLEITENLLINNGSRFSKIYFDIDSFRPTYITGNRYDAEEGGFDGLDIIVGGKTTGAMVSFVNPTGSGFPYTYFKREVRLSTNLTMGGAIKGYGNNDLMFWDNATGYKTLKQLSEGGEAGEHTHSAADITSGLLAMTRGGTGNDHGDAESVGGWGVTRLTGNPASFPSDTCRSWTWYGYNNSLAVVASPDLSYESSPDCGGIVAYVTKQEESTGEITVYVYNGSGSTQKIGVRCIVIMY